MLTFKVVKLCARAETLNFELTKLINIFIRRCFLRDELQTPSRKKTSHSSAGSRKAPDHFQPTAFNAKIFARKNFFVTAVV
ncbi:MAG: hypothetical protein DRR19_32845 [Candidatus Parabeggiatoa sp. nov. 1]|nr:MAG: hypothetical protein DRR19_32845 [Gammaproteobacteria bacterium]